MKAGSDRAALLVSVATVSGLVLRLVFALVYWVDKPLTNDEQEYLLLARSLARSQTFAYPPRAEGGIEVARFGRPPVYPYFLSRLAAGSLVEFHDNVDGVDTADDVSPLFEPLDLEALDGARVPRALDLVLAHALDFQSGR